MPFSAAFFPTENFCAGVSEIYGPRDLLSLDMLPVALDARGYL